MHEVYRHHGLSKVIVSDRDSKFTSEFWTAVHKTMGTRLNISTSYHPQTDGQSERTNRTLEHELRVYAFQHHTDWSKYLDIAEFNINIHVNASTGFSPFQTVYGFTPDTYGSLVLQTKQGPAYDWLKDRADIQKLVSTNLVEAKLFQEHYANKRVREAELHVGDRVAIRTEGLRLQGQPSSILRQRYIGPFEVIEKFSPLVYKLKLPKAYSRIHHVFHISKLRLYWRDDRKYPERFVSEAVSEQHADIAQGETLIDSILDVKIA